MKTVLIVEDMKDFADCLKFVLTHKGYNVVTAENGIEGLEQAMKVKPDLILLDVFMPDQDGPETAMLMREQLALMRVPIVFLTALTSGASTDDNEIVIQGESYPAISKMMDQEEIARRVSQFLY